MATLPPVCSQSSHHESEEILQGPIFSPPVYRQRYDAVVQLSRKLHPKKVVDMGCGECKLLRSLKFENYIEELIGVDINVTALQTHQHYVQPLTTDYLIRRPRPLKVQLLKGSIDEVDGRLMGTDLLTCIEVIEHLHDSVLEQVPRVIFGKLQPAVVMISTPNADFNVLFPNLIGFRHYDHKFEWGRREFQEWCIKACNCYNYLVQFDGVGDPPLEMSYLGHCSQIAIFTRQQSGDIRDREISLTDTPYEQIYECRFPHELNTPEQRLSNEAHYLLRVLFRRRIAQNEQRHLLMGCTENGLESNDMEHTSIENNDENGHQQQDESSPFETSHSLIINLLELLDYPQIQRFTTNVDEISQALRRHSSVELTTDGLCAILYDELEDSETESVIEETSEDEEDIIDNIGYIESTEVWD